MFNKSIILKNRNNRRSVNSNSNSNRIKKLIYKNKNASIEQNKKEILESVDNISYDFESRNQTQALNTIEVEKVTIGDGNDYENFGYKKPTLKEKLPKITKKQLTMGGYWLFLSLD